MVCFSFEIREVVVLLRPTVTERPISDATRNLGKPLLLPFSPHAGRRLASQDCWPGKVAHVAVLWQSGREAMLALEKGVVSGNLEREASLVRKASDACVCRLVLVGDVLRNLLIMGSVGSRQ